MNYDTDSQPTGWSQQATIQGFIESRWHIHANPYVWMLHPYPHSQSLRLKQEGVGIQLCLLPVTLSGHPKG